jgi:hypothetical protein
MLSCFHLFETNIEPLVLFSEITLELPISPMPDPACYNGMSLTISYLILNLSTSSKGCKYCSEPCSVSCWVYLAPNLHWIHLCDDCVDNLQRLTGFDLCQYPYRWSYSNSQARQSLYFSDELVWSCLIPFSCFWTRTFECILYYQSHTWSNLRGRTSRSLFLGRVICPLRLEDLFGRRNQRRWRTWYWRFSARTTVDQVFRGIFLVSLWSRRTVWVRST